jgi:hypothetical protein
MIGRNLLTTSTVQPVRVSADGSPLYKAGGVTIDWTTVVAVAGSDVTLPDGDVIRIGQKYLRYGQVITKITASGKFGPYDPGAGDGRQTLARGNAYILDETWLQYTARVRGPRRRQRPDRRLHRGRPALGRPRPEQRRRRRLAGRRPDAGERRSNLPDRPLGPQLVPPLKCECARGPRLIPESRKQRRPVPRQTNAAPLAPRCRRPRTDL